MNHQRRMAAGLLALAAVAFVLSRSFPSTPAPDDAPPPPPVAEPSKPQPARGPVTVKKVPGARRALPRPAAPAPEAPPAPAPGPAPAPDDTGAAAEDGDTGDVLPERGRLASPEVPFTPDALMAAVGDGMPEVQACVEDWLDTMTLDAALEGRLAIEVTLTPDGVADATLLDVEGMPGPLLSCFGGVVYEIAWPRPEEETTITVPFVVTDAGDGEE